MSPKDYMDKAKAERDAHAETCPRWDCEGSDCLECQDHDNAVARARRSLAR